jgi:hypothetical protein
VTAHAASRTGVTLRSRHRPALTALLLVLGLLLAPGVARAAQAVWRVESLSNSMMAPGGSFTYIVQVNNVGDESTDGSPFTVEVALPTGITAVSASNGPGGEWDCVGPGGVPVAGQSAITCTQTNTVLAQDFTTVLLDAAIDPSAAEGVVTSSVSVSGGGAVAASTEDPTRITTDPPTFGVDAFDGQVAADASGTPYAQAGGHPYSASTTIDYTTTTSTNPLVGQVWPPEPTKDVVVDLPPGLIVNPTATATCTVGELANSEVVVPKPTCPPASQVGTVLVRFNSPINASIYGPLPLFDVVPPPDKPAAFGFNVAGSVVTLDGSLRSGSDYGLTAHVRNIPEALDIAGTTLTFWGVPSDASHDLERACPGENNPWRGGPSCRSGAPRTALLRLPTSCTSPGEGLMTFLHIDSWTHPGMFVDSQFESHDPPAYPSPRSRWGAPRGPENCASIPFDPLLSGAPPASAQTGSPSGFSFDLTLPQSDDPDVVGEGDLKEAVVTLPAGVALSPSSANGLDACTAEQIALRSDADPTCPDASRVGTLTIDTPLLDDPLTGAIYLAKPHDNPFDSLVAIYLVARGPGLVVKLAGKVELDPATGQVRTTFDDNPQTPFSRLHLQFEGGSRAPLVAPPACGSYQTHAVFTSWSGRVVSSDSSFTIDHGFDGGACGPRGFSPSFSAGTEDPGAGKTTALLVSMARGDGDQQFKDLTLDLPKGVTAKVAKAELCADAAADIGMCGDASRIGTVKVGAGAGPTPFWITNGRVYLTGPYKGAPFGLSIVVPAVAGPFDLGNVFVRGKILVDKHTAQLSTVTDPLPTILQGIPLDVRDVRVEIDRPDFIINPTNCRMQHATGAIGSVAGSVAHVSSRFRATDCALLPLKPRMTLRVGGSGHTHRNASSSLIATLRQQPGQANLRSVRVVLPKSINARLNVINDACTRAEFETDISKCAHAKAGTATAVTPLLRDPLKGNAYFVKNGHPIPDLFVALRGQVDVDLIGRITIPGGKRLAATFSAIPDVPVTSFSLRLLSGKNASIGAARNLCTRRAKAAKASLSFAGQNGKVVRARQPLRIVGCKKRTSRKRH